MIKLVQTCFAFPEQYDAYDGTDRVACSFEHPVITLPKVSGGHL
jgi:hypothetical protein